MYGDYEKDYSEWEKSYRQGWSGCNFMSQDLLHCSQQCMLNKISISESVVAGKCGIIMNCKW